MTKWINKWGKRDDWKKKERDDWKKERKKERKEGRKKKRKSKINDGCIKKKS